MNDEMERRLRDSLQARAQDVEPTPELYARVEATMNRSKRWTAALAGVGIAAAVAVGAVAVPNLLDDGGVDAPIVDDPSEGPTPPTEPTPTPDESESPDDQPGDGALPGHVVLAGDDRIWVADSRTGEEVMELADFGGAENESEIVAVEVRPGSTIDDLTVVFLLQGEGDFTLGSVTSDGTEVSAGTYFPQDKQPSADLVGDALPVPAFDPTGSHLAWVEVLRGEDNLSPNLRVIGWSDGPGTGDRATDNASFTLDAIPVEHGSDFVVEDWVWTDEADGTRRGHLFLTGGAEEAWRVPIEEQGDGAVALDPGEEIELVSGDAPGDEPGSTVGNAVIDVTGSAEQTVRLLARGDGQGDVIWSLVASSDTGDPRELPVPDDLPSDTRAPGDAWMTADGGAVLLGFGGQVWLLADDGWVAYGTPADYGDVLR